MNRKKLSIDEQIMDMNSKGIIFIKQLKEENKMRAIIRFLGRHWIITTIIVTIVFAIVLPNLEALALSRGSDFINILLGGK